MWKAVQGGNRFHGFTAPGADADAAAAARAQAAAEAEQFEAALDASRASHEADRQVFGRTLFASCSILLRYTLLCGDASAPAWRLPCFGCAGI